jgi:metallo-beta-lactamase family protein
MLLDSAHIQAKDAEWLNRAPRGGRDRERREAYEPLYSVADVEQALTQFVPHEYVTPFEAVPGVEASFHEAGHIVGAASVRTAWSGNGDTGSLVFSGDLGRWHRPIIRDPAPLPNADRLIIEGTYGGKTHPDEDSLMSALERVVHGAIERGGRIVIPAFAVGRTQEVVYAFDQLISAGRIPEMEIYIDSPLAANVQAIVQKHAEVYDEETASALRRGEDPLGLRRVVLVREASESMKLNDKPGTFVTISASGMCEGGRILHHLKHTIADARHAIVIVGYQAEGTLGKRLVEGRPEVRIFGEPHEVHARIEVLNGFSAHADHDELVRQAKACSPRHGCAIVHADLVRAEALQAGLKGAVAARIPIEGETWDLA